MATGSASEFDRGRKVGKYEILTRLSVGGMAELFLAFLPGPGGFKKFVALKQILPDVKADESFVKMFLDEARITAAFNHANIGQVFDLGEDEQSHELYLAMEFIAGQNLEQVVKRAAKREVIIPVGFACRVVHDTCLGLHYAHAFTDPTGHKMPVVHRDVSPKNVMVTYGGQVKVIDYGIAKAKGRLNRTQVGIVKGTSGYMSPEQVKNEPLDGRTDLFAAATMLHELLAGVRLFTAPTDAAMMMKIVDGPAPPLVGVNPGVSQQLSDVVLKGLEKDRNARFATGKELARAIQQACPELYDDEQVAEVMNQLFEDKIALTRSLLDLANEGRDVASISRAVQGLATTEEPSDGTGKKKTGGAPVRSSATPRPAGPPPRSAASSQRLPKVGSGSTSRSGQSVRGLPTVGPGAKSSRSLPRAASRSSLPPVASKRREDEADAGDQTLPPGTKRPSKPPSPPPDRVAAAAQSPEDTVPPGTKKGGLGGLLAVLGVLLVLAGAGWAVAFGPLKEQARHWLKAETEEPVVVDTGPKPIAADPGTPSGVKPSWLIEKEKQQAQLAAEKLRQEEMEAAASDPERQKMLEEIQAQLQQLNALEEEQRQLKIEARMGKATGEANTKKITDLQAQIDELKALVAAKQEKSKATKKGGDSKTPGEVEVVRDSRSAKAADVGYMTLRTLNPSSAAVFLDNTSLGSTPLVKVPMDVGVHKLRLVDGDSKSRLLSVTIDSGKTLELKGVDVGSLPLAP
ncbi:MAG: protein kinase [Myxococcales bacterium]|nr:protein kinase [Myxococcales bacterium]